MEDTQWKSEHWKSEHFAEHWMKNTSRIFHIHIFQNIAVSDEQHRQIWPKKKKRKKIGTKSNLKDVNSTARS